MTFAKSRAAPGLLCKTACDERAYISKDAHMNLAGWLIASLANTMTHTKTHAARTHARANGRTGKSLVCGKLWPTTLHHEYTSLVYITCVHH